MSRESFLILLITVVLFVSCGDRNGIDSDSSIVFSTSETEKKIDVLVDGKLFTSFCWPENVYKPILYPVNTSSGTEITRGFPLNPREGERNDHIHQTGVWFNYGNVNGVDFWGNGYRGIKEENGGVIKHKRIERLSSKKGEGSFISAEDWLDSSGKRLLAEKTQYNFKAQGSVRIIDRITKLTAGDTAVLFKDTKEGLFAIRVARQLELISRDAVTLLDAYGNPSVVKDTLNATVTGNYMSSEGLSGDSVWGTRAKWMKLYGNIGNEKISITICDHKKNPGYPTFWHARGYGLFSANPLGRYDFTKGAEAYGFTIATKESAIFRYRIIISSGSFLEDIEIATYSDEFNKKYK